MNMLYYNRKQNEKSLWHYESEHLKSQWTEKLPQDKCRLATCNQIFAMKNWVKKNLSGTSTLSSGKFF